MDKQKELCGIVPISKNVVHLLQNRLEEVESLASLLSKEIEAARRNESIDRISVILSKSQNLESVLQSMKLNLVNLSTLTRQPSELEQKLVEMTDFYSEEMKKLSDENSYLMSNQSKSNERQQQTELEVQSTRLALDEATRVISEKNNALEIERIKAEDLQLQIGQLNEELTEERHLRFSLDKANNELGSKLDEMESLLKQEHFETKKFSKEFVKLKKEFDKKDQEILGERERQEQMEMEIVSICQELERRLNEIDELKREKVDMAGKMSQVHEQYHELNKQLESMQSLFEEFQKEKTRLEEKCETLSCRIEKLNDENCNLTQELVKAQNNDESARLIELRKQLRQTSKDKEQLELDNAELNSRVNELEASGETMRLEIKQLQQAADKKVEDQYDTIEGLQDQLSSLKSELMSLQGDKENLLTEVDGAVDAMEGERDILQSEINSYQKQLSTALDHLAEEKLRSEKLENRLEALNAKPDVTYFDKRLADLTNQKNMLSYENGKLQSQLECLQGELSLAKRENEDAEKTQHRLNQLEAKYKKAKQDLASYKHSKSQSEHLVQQAKIMSDEQEKKLKEAEQARNEAVKDAKTLATRVETLEEALKAQEVHGNELEHHLREDNSQVAQSLENMMALHTELQCRYETLQIELGKKDTGLNELKRERRKLQDDLNSAKAELESQKHKVDDLEGQQTHKTKNIEKEIKSVKADNSKLVKTLQDTLDLNEQLRSQVSLLEETLCEQRKEVDQLKTTSREKETQVLKDMSGYKTRIAELELQVSQERDKAYQKMEDQLKTVQRETESMLEKNHELTQRNSGLKSEMNTLEAQVAELKAELDEKSRSLDVTKGSLKKKTRQYDHLKDVELRYNELQESNQKLLEQSEGQQKTIDRFVSQFKELQQEMQKLVKLHTEQTDALEQKEIMLQSEEARAMELESKYFELKRQAMTLQALQKATETKMMEAKNDSVIATETLEDTNRLFKERFTALAAELQAAKKQKVDLEWRNLDKQQQVCLEKQQMEHATRQARDMIKASRHTLTKIADQAELDVTLRDNFRHSSPHRVSRIPDISIDEILSVSQQHPYLVNDLGGPQSLLASEATSPFTSSSQKLEAIIDEMERRRLIA